MTEKDNNSGPSAGQQPVKGGGPDGTITIKMSVEDARMLGDLLEVNILHRTLKEYYTETENKICQLVNALKDTPENIRF